jgi:hypothetical protein
LLPALSGSAAQLPDHYNSVHAIVWVVADLDAAVQGWTKIGFPGIENLGTVAIPQGNRSGIRTQPRPIGIAKGRIGETAVCWIRPMGDGGPHSFFLKKHGSGIFSLVRRAPSVDALEAEVARMQSLGVGVLLRGSVNEGVGEVRYVIFDTEDGGAAAVST